MGIPTIMELPSTDLEGTVWLKKYFTCVIDDVPIQADCNTIRLILKDEFGIDFSILNDRLQDVLPYMFLYYLKSWPGWQKHTEYVNGKLTFTEWLLRFKQYLHLKLSNVIRNTFNQVYQDYQKEELSSKISEVAPFKIKINGPPSLLNNIIFVNIGDDAVIKRHMGPRFNDMSFEQLVNWPSVEIEFFSPEFSFVRRNTLFVERYLSGTNEKIRFPDGEFIEQAQVVTPHLTRQVLAYELLKLYIEKYLKLIEVNTPSFDQLEDVTVTLDQFLKDVEELGLGSTIATNTQIVFNIGGCKYVRSKKVKSSFVSEHSVYSPSQEEPAIKYFEVITPKLELYVKFFKSVPFKRGQNDIDFVFLSSEKNKSANILPALAYKCTYCNKSLENSKSVSAHFMQEHGMEQLLYCLKCHSKYEVNNLVLSRWKHECS